MNLLFNARMAVTDSGGLQEESTYLGIPCFTLRANTERPITITQGTNQLCGPSNLLKLMQLALAEDVGARASRPEFWDGHTANRVVESISHFLKVSRRS
jgi:UDP-N-acetylglucosamine 2-epimerase (non-hydrolysing)